MVLCESDYLQSLVCSKGWGWAKHLQLGPLGSSDSWPVIRYTVGVSPTRFLGELLPFHWIVPWWSRLACDLGEEGWEPSPRATSVSTANYELYRHGSRDTDGHVLPPAPGRAELVSDHGCRGWCHVKCPFRVSWYLVQVPSHQVPKLAGEDCGWEDLEQNIYSVRISRSTDRSVSYLSLGWQVCWKTFVVMSL